jgi:predicted small lipoprotein YifL
MTMKQILLSLMLLTALAGCGVRGNPEPPPNFTQSQ